MTLARAGWGLALVVAATALVTGCATTSPRFDQDVATTFAQDDMRRLTTADVELYYPANHREQALRVAARASECLIALRAHQLTGRPRDRALLFLTSSNFNNAYVGGQAAGEPLHSLVPLSATAELFHWYGLSAADTGDIACHEMFHFVHFEQVENLWRLVNAVVGPVVPSQAFLERWFTEGVAQYYEGRLRRATGRPHSPLYRGAFDSFVALRRGELQGGDFSLNQRELAPFGGAYLTGLAFVEWLATTYGEDKLWQLMEVQGRSVFSPLGATLRFRQVYGMSAGALLDVWRQQLTGSLVVRERPVSQKVVMADVGQLARLAAHPGSGAMAMVSSGAEQVPMLRVFERDGTLRFEERLARIAPDRDWVLAGPGSMSGLSFTADGRFLFLMNDDLIDRGDTRAQVWKVDASTGEVVQVWQTVARAMGGSVSADGRTYTYVEFPASGGPRVLERDLQAGTDTLVVALPASVSVAGPAWSPQHTRLAFATLDGNGWNLMLREADGSLRHLTTDGAFNFAARWVDETHLVFARTAGTYLQVHRLDVDSGALERLSDAPYGIIDPSPVPGGVAVVNRDGVHWSLDVVASDSPLELVQASFPTEPEAVPARHEPAPLAVQSDEAYSPVDQLFVPQLRMPGVLGSLASDVAGRTIFVTSLSLSLSGRDRLARHSWAINGSFDLPTMENAVSVSYRNAQLAPWAMSAVAGRQGFFDEAYWSGALSVERTVFTVPVSLGLQAQLVQPVGGAIGRYLGPFFSLAWGASESTPYGGVQRQLAFSIDVAGYPRVLGSDRDLVDLRVGVSLATPLPVSKRHSLLVSVAGRVLPGAPDGALRIGGVSRGTALWVSADRSTPRGPGVFLPGSLVEALRGYDDFVVRATQTAIATVRYRYAFIIDRGFMSTLYLFPSLFFRQVDLELFGSAAVTNSATATWARAVGATAFVRALGGGALPLTLYYQFAWRFDFGLPPLHTVGFAFE